MRLPVVALIAAVAACASTSSRGDAVATASSVEISGEIAAPASFDAAALAALGGQDIEWAHHGRRSIYVGVPLADLLGRCGLAGGKGGPDADPRTKHLGWRRVVKAVAADGFEAVFSSAELLPEIGSTRAFVAFRKDGQALATDEGPLRLLVTTDGKGSRSVRNLARIEVLPAP
jgi:DMSO/TMAO reductase YedYZ molybdopterin-dependent catalytic subunit